MAYLFMFFAVLFNCGGNIFLKYSSKAETNLFQIVFLISGLFLGGINAFFYTKSLTSLKLSIAFPIFSGGSIILIALVSLFIFKDKIDFVNIAGMVLIVSGIMLLSK